MDNRYETMKQEAIADCKAGRFHEAEEALSHLLDVLRRYGAPVENSPVMYWHLVARYKGDEKRAMDKFTRL